jgi:hypothetical protein
MAEMSGHANGAKPKHKRTPESRLKEKCTKLEEGILRLMTDLRLSRDGLQVRIVGDKIVVHAQACLMRKSDRLRGVPNSEDEMEPA